MQALAASDTVKELFATLRFYNAKMHGFATAAANTRNNGESVDGWATSPEVADAGRVAGSMASATSLF